MNVHTAGKRHIAHCTDCDLGSERLKLWVFGDPPRRHGRTCEGAKHGGLGKVKAMKALRIGMGANCRTPKGALVRARTPIRQHTPI
eukprot:9477658-Pyramimonas_sp.AAC.1